MKLTANPTTTEEKLQKAYDNMRKNNIAYHLHFDPDEHDVLWAPVVIDGIELPYKISTYGDLINSAGVPISSFTRDDGYVQYKVQYQGKDYTRKAHRLVAEAFIPNDDPIHKTQVDHVYGNKADNWWRVLEWVTPQENVQRAWNNGLCDEGLLHRSGEGHGMNKYPESIIRSICERLEKGINPIKISDELDIPVSLVYGVQYGAWKIVSKDYKITDAKGKPIYTTRTLTTDEATQACELMSQGVWPSDVARQLNISLNTVHNLRTGTQYKEICQNYNLDDVKFRSVSDDDAHKVCQLYQSGKMPAAIHRELPHISIGTIQSIVSSKDSYQDIKNQYDFTLVTRTKDRSIPNETVHLICKMLEKGNLPVDISKQTGFPTVYIQNIRAGIAYKDISKQYTFPDNFKTINRKYDPEVVRKVCEQLQAGVIQTKIAEDTGVDICTVRNIRNRQAYNDISSGYKFPDTFIVRELSDEQVHKICQMLQNKIKAVDIAAELDIDVKRIFAIKSRTAYRDISKNYTFYKKNGTAA